jgi:hypothetical protein
MVAPSDNLKGKQMREALIILPLHDRFAFHHRVLRAELIKAFGGVTTVDAQGAWWNEATDTVDAEPVRIYTIAAEPTAENWGTVKRLAYEAGFRCGQDAVYYRGFDGEVTIKTINDDCS